MADRGSGGGQGPVVVFEGDAECGEAGEVDGCGSGVDVGADAGHAATSRLAAAPEPASEVSNLAFDDGTVGAVALDPFGCALFGSGGLEQCLVATDGD